MQQTGFVKTALAWVLILNFLHFANFIPVAESASASSTVTIAVLEEISIQEETPLNFGEILAPVVGIQDFTVNLDGSTTPGPGTGSFNGGQSEGRVSFFGNDNAVFTISILLGSCQGFTATVALTEIRLPPGPLYTLDTTLNIGGTVSVPSDAGGSGFCEFTLSADYQ